VIRLSRAFFLFSLDFVRRCVTSALRFFQALFFLFKVGDRRTPFFGFGWFRPLGYAKTVVGRARGCSMIPSSSPFLLPLCPPLSSSFPPIPDKGFFWKTSGYVIFPPVLQCYLSPPPAFSTMFFTLKNEVRSPSAPLFFTSRMPLFRRLEVLRILQHRALTLRRNFFSHFDSPNPPPLYSREFFLWVCSSFLLMRSPQYIIHFCQKSNPWFPLRGEGANFSLPNPQPLIFPFLSLMRQVCVLNAFTSYAAIWTFSSR